MGLPERRVPPPQLNATLSATVRRLASTTSAMMPPALVVMKPPEQPNPGGQTTLWAATFRETSVSVKVSVPPTAATLRTV
jgi:hypothetical protein